MGLHYSWKIVPRLRNMQTSGKFEFGHCTDFFFFFAHRQCLAKLLTSAINWRMPQTRIIATTTISIDDANLANAWRIHSSKMAGNRMIFSRTWVEHKERANRENDGSYNHERQMRCCIGAPHNCFAYRQERGLSEQEDVKLNVIFLLAVTVRLRETSFIFKP